MTIRLTQAEADRLLRLEKISLDSTAHKFPASGGKCSVSLVSGAGKAREDFLFDMYRGRVGIRTVCQTRGRKVVSLARLDFGGAPHRNPDGKEIAVPHLHLYYEGYDDKWAFPLSPAHFSDEENPQSLLDEFLRYCNIVNIRIQMEIGA